jgi:hypothetical protein
MMACDDFKKAASPLLLRFSFASDAGAASDAAFLFQSLRVQFSPQSAALRFKRASASVTVVSTVTGRVLRALVGAAAVASSAAGALNYPYLGFHLSEEGRGLWLVSGNVFAASFTGRFRPKLC